MRGASRGLSRFSRGYRGGKWGGIDKKIVLLGMTELLENENFLISDSELAENVSNLDVEVIRIR